MAGRAEQAFSCQAENVGKGDEKRCNAGGGGRIEVSRQKLVAFVMVDTQTFPFKSVDSWTFHFSEV